MALTGDSLRRAGQRGPVRDAAVVQAQREIIAIVYRATWLCLGARHAEHLDAACQDVLERVLSSAHRYEDANSKGPTASPRTWVYARATGYARNFRRQLQREAPHALVQYDDEQSAPDTLPHDEELRMLTSLDGTTTRALLDAVLARVDDVYRDVLTLYCWAELTDTEIAAELRISVPAAKSRRQRGLEELRRVLARAPFAEARELAQRIDAARILKARSFRRGQDGGAA